jgi:3-oxoacyl-[acyl-carrier protein] reductase
MADNFPVMILTGTSKGIGKGIAEHFLNKNYIVFGCSRGTATIESANYYHTQLDVSNEKQVREWIRSIKNTSQEIDILVCNAGIAPAAILMTMTSGSTIEDLLKINIAGTYYVCREVAKVMMSYRKGRIITLSSMSVGLHEEGTSAYSSSKSAIIEMTKIMAKELAPFDITCNVVAPSMYMTDAVKALGNDVITRALNKLTIKRVLRIEEICNVISFLSSPESSCITGQVIHMGLVC